MSIEITSKEFIDRVPNYDKLLDYPEAVITTGNGYGNVWVMKDKDTEVLIARSLPIREARVVAAMFNCGSMVIHI